MELEFFLQRLSVEAAVLVTVVQARGSVPREVGAWMAVWPLGQLGTIGGGHLEWDALRRARSALKSAHPIPCTECHQCACPAGVEIPAVFAAYNAAHLFPEPPLSHAYGQLSPDKRASQCTGCGMCEMLCPEQIRIRIQVARAADYFGDKR